MGRAGAAGGATRGSTAGAFGVVRAGAGSGGDGGVAIGAGAVTIIGADGLAAVSVRLSAGGALDGALAIGGRLRAPTIEQPAAAVPAPPDPEGGDRRGERDARRRQRPGVSTRVRVSPASSALPRAR